jgi:glycosyltransferase involved in cell wall biosynthesis
MCTYRGEAFVAQQLQTVLQQSRPPDEVVIRDDASDDGTIAILEQLAVDFTASGIDISLLVNERNVGVTANFGRCVSETTGDLIFLCDQDDIWHRDKIATVAAEFERRPELSLVFTDAALVDASGTALGHSLFDALAMTRRERAGVRRGDAFDFLLRRNLATGATIAFRRELLHAALPIGDGWLHDEWLALVAAATGRVDVIEGATIEYRQHTANQVGVRRLSARNLLSRLTAAHDVDRKVLHQRALAMHERLTALGVDRAKQARANEKVLFCEQRLHYPDNRAVRLFAISRQAVTGRYHRAARGMIAIARDVVVPADGL